MAGLQGISQQLLQSLTPSAIDSFQQGQINQQGVDRGEQQAQIGQQKLDANSMKLAQGELTNKGQEANSLLTFKTPEELRANLIRRAQEVTANPVPGLEASDFIDMANRLGEPNGFTTIQNELKSDLARISDISQALLKQRFIGTPQRVSRGGKNFLVGLVQEPDGTFRTEEQEIVGSFVSPLGETGAQQTTRLVGEAGGKAEATELGKAAGQEATTNIVAKSKADIAKAVSLATQEAKARGETLTDLNRANASLPGLRDVVGQLKELAPLATSTIFGKTFDFAVKESGFGSTKGANARAKFIGIINNQILPLLKQTFGAAFTKAEGDELKKTMGDPDSSPEEKLVQLDAFIEGKAREIQAKERELGQEVTPASELLPDDLSALSDEDLAAQIAALKGGQ